MHFSEYQDFTLNTAAYPNNVDPDRVNSAYTYLALKLNSEAGEVADKFGKIIRDKNEIISEEDKEEIALELGDIQWYVARLAAEIGFDLDDIAQKNIDKLLDRQERGVISGSGDHR